MMSWKWRRPRKKPDPLSGFAEFVSHLKQQEQNEKDQKGQAEHEATEAEAAAFAKVNGTGDQLVRDAQDPSPILGDKDRSIKSHRKRQRRVRDSSRRILVRAQWLKIEYFGIHGFSD
jgi:hypothetical protein